MNKQRRAALAKALPLVEQAQALLAQARGIVQEVRDEEDEILQNMSEGAQASDRGEEIRATVDDLDEEIDCMSMGNLASVASALARIAERPDPGLDAADLSGPALEKRREGRLPEWARERIRRAETAAAEADARLAGAFGEPDPEDPGRIVVDQYGSPLRGKVVPSDQVAFPGLGLRVAYDRRHRALSVTSTEIGSLVVLPHASNTLSIRADRL